MALFRLDATAAVADAGGSVVVGEARLHPQAVLGKLLMR